MMKKLFVSLLLSGIIFIAPTAWGAETVDDEETKRRNELIEQLLNGELDLKCPPSPKYSNKIQLPFNKIDTTPKQPVPITLIPQVFAKHVTNLLWTKESEIVLDTWNEVQLLFVLIEYIYAKPFSIEIEELPPAESNSCKQKEIGLETTTSESDTSEDTFRTEARKRKTGHMFPRSPYIFQFSREKIDGPFLIRKTSEAYTVSRTYDGLDLEYNPHPSYDAYSVVEKNIQDLIGIVTTRWKYAKQVNLFYYFTYANTSEFPLILRNIIDYLNLSYDEVHIARYFGNYFTLAIKKDAFDKIQRLLRLHTEQPPKPVKYWEDLDETCCE